MNTPTESTGGAAPSEPPVPPVPPAPPVDSAGRGWRRLARGARPRWTRLSVFAALLAVALGFAIAAQVHQTSVQGLETLREDELVRILDTVNQQDARLDTQIRELELSRDRLSTSTADDEARRAAEERLESLEILTGTAPATGPGMVLTIRDPRGGVTAPLLLDAVQELRDAGAETIQINDQRVVVDTYFTDADAGVEMSGVLLAPPYVITAIGDGTTIASAMDIPGGVSESVRRVDATSDVEIKKKVDITALQTVSPPQYARPVPSPAP